MYPRPVLSLPEETRADAEREVSRAPRCSCCLTARVHLAKYIGSTLFLDDNPDQLQLALPIAERAQWTPRLLAAFILLSGRARVDLHPRTA
jgi:hypothetical protein